MFACLYKVCTQSSREGADYTHWDPSLLSGTRRQLTLVNIFRISLRIYPPSFICILVILFVLICTGSFVNKIVLRYEGAPKYLGESVTGTKTGSEMKQWHYVLLVKMVNWRGCWQVHRQLLTDRLHMHSGFPTKMMKQTIMTSFNYVTRMARA